ncbi:tyrosine protein phosphatase, partial [Levilactobacillus brevis]
DVATRFNDDARAILNGEEIVKPEFTRISVLKKKKRFWLF